MSHQSFTSTSATYCCCMDSSLSPNVSPFLSDFFLPFSVESLNVKGDVLFWLFFFFHFTLYIIMSVVHMVRQKLVFRFSGGPHRCRAVHHRQPLLLLLLLLATSSPALLSISLHIVPPSPPHSCFGSSVAASPQVCFLWIVILLYVCFNKYLHCNHQGPHFIKPFIHDLV